MVGIPAHYQSWLGESRESGFRICHCRRADLESHAAFGGMLYRSKGHHRYENGFSIFKKSVSNI
jgi:hypothetical protein